MTSDSYVARMRAYIEDHVLADEYVAGIAAAEHVDKLRAADPELLDGFLREYAPTVLREFITGMRRARRSHRARWAGGTAFAEAAEAHAAGDGEALNRYRYLDAHYTVDAAHTSKRLGDLVAAELQFVANDFTDRAARNQVKALAFQAMAKRVGRLGGCVQDHYTDAQLAAMFGAAGDSDDSGNAAA